MRVEAQVLQRLARAGNESTQRAESLRKGAVGKRDTAFAAESFRRAASVFTTRQNGMGFIDENARAVRLGNRDQLGQISEIAVHRVNAFEHDELPFTFVSA